MKKVHALFAGLEGFVDPDDVPVPETELTVPYGDQTNDGAVEEAGVEVDEVAQGVDETIDTVATLEGICKEITQYIGNGTYTHALHSVMQTRADHECRRIGLKATALPALESYSTAVACGDATIESIGEKIKAGAQAVWKGILWLIDKILGLFRRTAERIPDLRKRAEAAKKAVSAKAGTPAGTITRGGVAALLTVDGSTSATKTAEKAEKCWGEVTTYATSMAKAIFDGRKVIEGDGLKWLNSPPTEKPGELHYLSGKEVIEVCDRILKYCTSVEAKTAEKSIEDIKARILKASGGIEPEQSKTISEALTLLAKGIVQLNKRWGASLTACEVSVSKHDVKGEKAASAEPGKQSRSTYTHALEHIASQPVYLKLTAKALAGKDIKRAPASQGEISAYSEQAAIKFSPEYLEYLTQYGVISVGSIETYGLGVGADSHLHLAKVTDSLTNVHKLPKGHVPLADIMDGWYYLYDNTSRKVVEWSAVLGSAKSSNQSLDVFLAGYIEKSA